MTLNECPNCRTILIVDASDADLIDTALGRMSSDYNDVDHEAIARLRERIREALKPSDTMRATLAKGGV